jgi:hypothetical protein
MESYIQIKENISSRFQLRSPDAIPIGILVGKTGVGKTTVENNLCGTDYTFGAGLGSMTKYLHRNAVLCGDNAFDLIDTPGTDSKDDCFRHAYLLKKALTLAPLHTIFLIIRYEPRFEKILDTYEELSEKFVNYGHKFVVMISHWDLSKNPEQDFQQICKVLDGYCSNIICYSEKSIKEQLSALMYLCICNMKSESLNIPDESFILNFNVVEIKNRIRKGYNEYKKRINEIHKEFENAITRGYNDEDRNDVLFYLLLEFRDELENLLNEFSKEYGAEMTELDYYIFYIKMQDQNRKLHDELSEKVGKLMNLCPFDNLDPKNLIKQCPHCGVIWFKVEGCDGETTCGNKVIQRVKDTQTSKPFQRIKFKRNGGILEWTKSVLGSIASIVTSKPKIETPKKSNPIGCGARLVWRDLPPISDDLILELFKVKDIEEVRNLIKDLKFQEIRKNYEDQIDTSFH